MKRILPTLAALTLAACTSVTTTRNWQSENAPHTFTAAGRLAVKQNDKGSYANFDWARSSHTETIDINTPLGNTLGQLCQDPQGVIATDANGKTYQAPTPEALSQQLLGYQIPVQYLSTWAHGEYLATVPHSIMPNDSLKQLGWTISRQTHENGSLKQLELQNPTLTIRMIFTDISPNNDAGSNQCGARSPKHNHPK